MNIHIVKKERCVNWTTYILFHIFNCFFFFLLFSHIYFLLSFSLIFLKSFSFSYFILLLYSFPHLIPTSHSSLYPSLTSSPLPYPPLSSPHPSLLFLLLNLEKKSACTLHECLENGCIFDYLVFGVIHVVYITNKPS